MHVSDAEAVSRAINVKEAAKSSLMSIPGVQGMGVGCKSVGGKPTDELAIIFYVHKKLPLSELSANQLIPPEIEGIKTDVVESPVSKCFDDVGRYRPLVSGSQLEYTTSEQTSTGGATHFKTGTLGCFAKARRKGKKVILTAGHVAAGCGDPNPAINHRRLGQPDDTCDCSCCSKCWSTVVGTVVDARVDPDAGLIQIDKCIDTSPNVRVIGPIHGVLNTTQINGLGGKTVRVRGAKTEMVKTGTVMNVHESNNTECVEFEGGPSVSRAFTDAIRVNADRGDFFGQPGDSGSAVLDENGNLIGLLFAGFLPLGMAQAFGHVARIDRILNEFQADWDLEILTAQNAASFAASSAPSPAPHAFAAIEPPRPAIEGLQPTEEELQLVGRTRDELLASPMGQRFSQLVARHVSEIQSLIRTRKRVAAVWRRVTAPDLLQAGLSAIRSPERPLTEFVSGMSLADRISAMTGVLARYGSESLIADLKAVSLLATQFTSKSYADIIEWMKTAPPDALPAPSPSLS
jgi:hypothetical protein